MRTRSGRAVVAVVLAIGVGLGALGSWWLVRARPVPGEFIDAIATADGGAVVICHQRGEARHFVEVYGREGLRWRALIPRYAGAVGTPAIAATPTVVTVRVVRDGHPFVFAFDTAHGSKIASFDLVEAGPADARAYTAPGLATVFADGWSVEVVTRPGGGAQLIAMELDRHLLAWKVDVATVPTAVWIGDGQVVARLADATVAAWALADGAPTSPTAAAPPPASRAQLAAAAITLDGHTVAVPPTAVAPQPYHAAGDRVWMIEPRRLTILDASLAVVRTMAR